MDKGKEREDLIRELRILRDRIGQEAAENYVDAYRYEIMAEDAPLIIFAHREKFIYVNKAAALFSGYTKDELYEMYFWEIVHPDFQDIVKARGFKHLKGELAPGYYEIKIKKKNGESCWVACGSKHVDDFRGTPAVIASAIDITDKKQAERELKTQKNYFKSLFDYSPSAIALLDKEDNVIQINKSFQTLFKYSFDEVKGKNIKDLIATEPLKKDKEYLSQKLLRGEVLNHDTIMLSNEGGEIDVRLSGGPIVEDGETIGVFALYDDIRERKRVEKQLKENFRKLTKVLAGTVSALSETIGKRDPFTAGHQRRVSQLALAIGKEKSFSKGELKILKIASNLHDIGKIHIPTMILNKPSKLSPDEMALVKNHTRIGYNILKTIDFPGPVAKIVLQHHERINGSGYPMGSDGPNIIAESKILAVADVVEAMSARRPYRDPLSIAETLNKLINNRGTLYDPEVVDICISLFKRGFKFKEVDFFDDELLANYDFIN